MVEEMLAARGIIVSHESVRQWARKFGQAFANIGEHGKAGGISRPSLPRAALMGAPCASA
jgi:hypothetical protein